MINYLNELPLTGAFIGTIVATILTEWMFRRFFVRVIRRATLALHNDPTNYRYLGHVFSGIIYVVGFIIAIREVPALRTIAGSLLAGAGIFAVVIGFASQYALNNIVSGFFIVIFKPFRVNDRLKIRKEYAGVVEDITLRHTIIRDPENRRIIIPNSVMNTEIIVNFDYTDNKICKYVDITIALDADIDRARTIMQQEVEKHPFFIDTRNESQKANGEPPVIVRTTAILPYGVSLRANAWALDNGNAYVMCCDLLESIKKRFDQEGIKIPNVNFVQAPKNDE